MYTLLPSFVLGFHGCDRQTVGEPVLAGKLKLKESNNEYDWLGPGLYFWENNPERALSYAQHLKKKSGSKTPTINEPYVIGAVIDLGYCLNLTDENALREVSESYLQLKAICETAEIPLPINTPGYTGDHDLLRRNLDCAVFAALHKFREEAEQSPYESIRSPFWEGGPLFEGTKFCEKTHIQLCVRDYACIKGFFRPLKNDGTPLQPVKKSRKPKK